MTAIPQQTSGAPLPAARRCGAWLLLGLAVSITQLVGILSLALPAAAQESSVNMQHVSTAAEWMKNPSAAKRKAAYLTFRTMNAAAVSHYKSALDAAEKFHHDAIASIDRAKNALNEHHELAKQRREERSRLILLIRTDYHKDEKKVNMLRDEMEDLMDLHEKLVKLAKKDLSTELNRMESSLEALAEIAREREKFTPSTHAKKLSDKELRESLISESLEAERVEKAIASLLETRKEIAVLAEVGKYNDANAKWCTAAMKSFATVVNYERSVVGLRPLFVEEKLSDAALGHSIDMATKGFFAHESPVPNKTTPWDRAKLAEFDGHASGENIFMGSGNFQAAYDGWFGSDGHRFGMFADGPNCMGLGVSALHWTMMTGSKKGWP